VSGVQPLACPRCAARHSLDERFCRECGMPLVYVGKGEEEPITDAHGRARKIKPQYARGELRRAGTARNQAEAELMQGILLEEGVPSILKRTGGFDVPDFLAAGPRDVLVPESAWELAHELLSGPDVIADDDPGHQVDGSTPSEMAPARLLVYMLIVLALAAGIVWVFSRAVT
jgi:pimeloyl-ACP methyl ester carboxylesterase